MNSNISIILVEPENPDNIGAVARAMKNMGFQDLRLISPPLNWKIKGRKMALSARDVLQSAKIYSNLKKAISDVHLVVGTTRRQGVKRGRFVDLEEGLEKIRQIAFKKSVALVFGKESKGLDNTALNSCDWLITIPSSEDYPSLNLAQAVMIFLFSLSELRGKRKNDTGEALGIASKKEIADLLSRWKKALIALDYEREGGDVIERIVATFHRLIKRNGLLVSEAQMFKGLSRRIQEKLMMDILSRTK